MLRRARKWNLNSGKEQDEGRGLIAGVEIFEFGDWGSKRAYLLMEMKEILI
jgi:hypothetical protein